jgi:hypothetical protein
VGFPLPTPYYSTLSGVKIHHNGGTTVTLNERQQDLIDALFEVIAERGEDYTTERWRNNGGKTYTLAESDEIGGQCRYIDPNPGSKVPSCLFGAALVKIGFNPSDLRPYNGDGINILLGLGLAGADFGSSPASSFRQDMAKIQGRQDNGERYGAIKTFIEELGYSPRTKTGPEPETIKYGERYSIGGTDFTVSFVNDKRISLTRGSGSDTYMDLDVFHTIAAKIKPTVSERFAELSVGATFTTEDSRADGGYFVKIDDDTLEYHEVLTQRADAFWMSQIAAEVGFQIGMA